MRNIKLVIEYDGTDFVGWQMQTNGRSVQGEITKVLEQVLQEHVNLIGAGRTDSGVHARGQVANFRTQSAMDSGSIMGALNGLLADDVHVRSATDVHPEFHSRFDARERWYRYFISRVPSAIGRRYQWFVKYPLDAGCMREIACKLVGTHDFASFCKADVALPHYRCTLSVSEWSEQGAGLVYDVRGNRFLYGMVRALVGTMVDIGRGYLPPSSLEEIMDAKERTKAGPAAPPHGLVLEEVTY